MRHIHSKGLKLFFITLICFCCTKESEALKESQSLLEINYYPSRELDFSIWQLNQFYQELQMGYIIRTDDDKISVIDGGGLRTTGILENYLIQLGGTVDTWIITHPHSDHIGAFLEITKRRKIKIKKLIHSFLDKELVKIHEPKSYDNLLEYDTIISQSSILIVDAKLNDSFLLGQGVKMKVLGIKNIDITSNIVNNSSLVFKIESKSKSILFLGDLGIEGGKKILKNETSRVELKSQYVQMAHHGANGVDRSFYEAVEAEYALWPTPDWLWSNNYAGKIIDEGNYNTLNVRKWMEELNIKKNYVAGLEGNIQID